MEVDGLTNEFKISIGSDVYSCNGGVFTVSEICCNTDVTIKDGDTLSFDDSGILNIKAENVACSSCVEFVKEKQGAERIVSGNRVNGYNVFPPNIEVVCEENTLLANDNMEYYFAICGALQLNIVHATGKQYVYTVEDFMIAKGNKYSSNDWIVGSRNLWQKDDEVRGYFLAKNYYSTSGMGCQNAYFEFRWYESERDHLRIRISENFEKIETTASWMKSLSDDKKLNQIIMPGSHDSGMAEIHNVPFGTAWMQVPYTVTQAVSIGEQLLCGARYFDIRIRNLNGVLFTYHRTSVLGGEGQSVASIFHQVRVFLETFPSETVIFKISHIYGNQMQQYSAVQQFCNSLVNIGSVLYKMSSDVDFSKITLKDLRGKLIVAIDFSESSICNPFSPSDGRFKYRGVIGIGGVEKNSQLSVKETYSNTTRLYKMQQDQLDKWKKNYKLIGADGSGLYTYSCTLTPCPPLSFRTTYQLAMDANASIEADYAQMEAYITDTKVGSLPNIMYIDYISVAVCEKIIAKNPELNK